MGTRGKFKYICQDCDAVNWLTNKERGSNFRPRCTSCGSLCLEPSKGSTGPRKLKEVRKAAQDSSKLIAKKMGKDI
jgi:hypothetical protein